MSGWAHPTARAPNPRTRGLTLIELMIVVAIGALMVSVTTMSVSAITHAHLRSTAIELSGAIKYCYDRAIMEKRTQRIVMDLDRGAWWIEATDDPYALLGKRVEGEEGKRPEKKEEKVTDSFFDSEELSEDLKLALEGGKAITFYKDEEAGEPRALSADIAFSKVWTGHQEEPFTSGIAYLHFFKGGWTEPAQIELSEDGEDFITLTVQPLTGKVKSYPRRLEDPEVEEDDGREEGDI